MKKCRKNEKDKIWERTQEQKRQASYKKRSNIQLREIPKRETRENDEVNQTKEFCTHERHEPQCARRALEVCNILNERGPKPRQTVNSYKHQTSVIADRRRK